MGLQGSSYKLQVRYAETDQMGVVYHANYLPWLELGRTEFLRDHGITYKSIEEAGVFVPVLGLDIRYLNPAFYDDRIEIVTRLTNLGAVKLAFAYEVLRLNDDQSQNLLATATTEHAWLNRARKPVRLRTEAPSIYQVLHQQWLQENGGLNS